MACWPDPGLVEAAELVELLQLLPHPEGGWYRELYRSSAEVTRHDGARRSALTQIHYLLAGGGLSRWHCVHGSDEVWQFLAGDPLELWMLPPRGGEPQGFRLGPAVVLRGPQNPAPFASDTGGTSPMVSVPSGWWQAAWAPQRWSLVSCVVAPGFAFEDFEMLHQRPADQHPPGALERFL